MSLAVQRAMLVNVRNARGRVSASHTSRIPPLLLFSAIRTPCRIRWFTIPLASFRPVRKHKIAYNLRRFSSHYSGDLAAAVSESEYKVRNRSSQPIEKDDEELEKLRHLVSEIKHGQIAAKKSLSARIMSLFIAMDRFEEGAQYWSFVRKTASQTRHGRLLYAIAIQLLERAGRPLQELEILYQEALAISNDGHLYGHNAVLLDRRKASYNYSEYAMQTLLMQIVLARYHRGARVDALLGLDTLLRVFPAMKRAPNVLLVLLPVPEGSLLTVVLCRAKCPPPETVMTSYLDKLRSMPAITMVNNVDLEQQTDLILLALEILRLETVAGQCLNEYQLAVLLSLLRHLAIIAAPSDGASQSVDIYNRRLISSTVKLLAGFMENRWTVASHESNMLFRILDMALVTCNSTAARAIHGRLIAMRGVTRTPLEESLLIRYSSVFLDLEGMRHHWVQLVSMVTTPTTEDWGFLAREVARFSRSSRPQRADAVAFLQSQLSELAPGRAELARLLLHDVGESRDQPSVAAKTHDTKCRSHINDVVDAAIEQLLRSKPSEEMLVSWVQWGPIRRDRVTLRVEDDTTTDPRRGSLSEANPEASSFAIVEGHLRKVYNELTQGRDEASNPYLKAEINAAGLPNDVHRYENWKDMNRILAMSEQSQRIKEEYLQSPDAAKLDPEEVEAEIGRIGFRAMRDWDGELGIGLDASYEQVRRKIMQLRRIPG